MNNGFRWKFASPAVEQELGREPETLLKSGIPVKHNPVRDVFRCGEYFCKIDRRPRRRFDREFAVGLKAAACNLPVVGHLACGRSENEAILITRALPDCEPLDSYLLHGVVDAPFLREYAAFLKNLFASGFVHGDAHAGNVLYQAQTNRFVLVDLHALRRKLPWEYFRFPEKMAVLLLALRMHLRDAEIVQLFADAGVRGGARIFERAMAHEAQRILREWPKRKAQLFAAYPKFARMEEGRLTRVLPVAKLPAEREICGTPAEAQSLFAASFFLDLALIPHRRVVAWKPGSGEVLRETAEAAAPENPDAVREMCSRLARFGLAAPQDSWGGKGALPRLENLDAVAAFPLFVMEG